LGLLIVLTIVGTLFLLSRPRLTVAYTVSGLALPDCDLDGGRAGLNFASEPGRLRTSIIMLKNAEGRIVVAEGARFLVVPRAIAFADSIYIDTAVIRRGQPRPKPVVIANRAFTLQAPASLLRARRVPFQEAALSGRADTFPLRVGPDGGELMLSGATPFLIGGFGVINALRIGGSSLPWWGRPSDTMQISATIRRPRMFFLSVRGDATLSHDSLSVRPEGDGSMLLLEDAPEIEIYLRQREAGWAGVAPTTGLSSFALPPIGTTVPPERSPVEFLDVHGFRNARCSNQPRATLVIGAERDTIGFVHTFEVRGAREAYLRFMRSEGTRYEGAADNVAINGDQRVGRRASAVPGEVLGALILLVLGAAGALVNALFHLEAK
jgi:hypothetical protein